MIKDSAGACPLATGIARAVDRLSAAMMGVAAFALLTMTLTVCYEVGSRYLFGRPTIWVWDINVQLMLLMVMVGMAEVYRRDGYVRVDVFTMTLSRRGKLVMDILYAPLIIFVAGIIVWTGWSYFQASYIRNQTASTTFAPLLWPVKFTIPFGAAILVCLVLLKLVRDIAALRADLAGNRSEKVA